MTTSLSAPGPRGAPTPLTLTARSPEDLLALAPVVLGFFPSDSVVMLTFGAATPFHARIDLPAGPEEWAGLAASLAAPAQQHGVQRVVLLLYGADRALSGQLWPVLRERFERTGIEVCAALRVEEERWYPLLGHDRRARELGVPFDITAHPFLVRAVVEGRITLTSRQALADTLTPDAAATARLGQLTSVLGRPGDLLAEGTWIETTLVRDLDADRLPEDREIARMVVRLADPRLRDAAWSVLTRERARSAVAWWTRVLTRCPGDLVAPPAALLAWSAWLHGNGALAWCALDRCEEAEPGYGLARVVAELLECAHPPTSWDRTIDWRSGLAGTPRAC